MNVFTVLVAQNHDVCVMGLEKMTQVGRQPQNRALAIFCSLFFPWAGQNILNSAIKLSINNLISLLRFLYVC